MTASARAAVDARERILEAACDVIAEHGIEAVTASEVADLAAELLTQPLTAAVVGPYDERDDLPAALRDLA